MASLPRLEMGELDPALADYLGPRVQRLGYLGEFFKCAGHQPQALLAFMEFTETSKAGLPKKLVELIALTVAGWMGNSYEKHQHERLSIRSGFGRDWVAAANSLAPAGQAELDPDEQLLQCVLLKILESRGHGASADFETLVETFGPDKAMAILMVAGRYVVHALIVNTLSLAPPVPSIFEDGFDG